MANPEIKQNEPSQIDLAEKELTGFMAGAEIGSSRLLAYSDELHLKSLRGRVEYFSKIGEEKNISQLRITETGMALLQQQIDNRHVEIKGYAGASFKVHNLLSRLETACHTEVYQDEGIPSEEKEYLEKDSFSEIAWGLYNSLTIEKEN